MMLIPRPAGTRVYGAALALWVLLPSAVLHAQLTSPPLTNPPNAPPPDLWSSSQSGSFGLASSSSYSGDAQTPMDHWSSQDGSFGSASSSSAGGKNPDSSGAQADFSSSGDGSRDAGLPVPTSGSAWGSGGSASSAGSVSSSSGGSGWGSPSEVSLDGLWNFRGGWNWDSPYLPPIGITLETDMKGEVALMPRRKVFFDPGQGFSASHNASASTCEHRFCLNISISSSYGAMSPLDAFVMDRYESRSELESDAFLGRGPVPMVNGQLSESELLLLNNGNAMESATSKYNHTRKTSWLLYSQSNDTDEIDIVMSFKQMYTLLPDYQGTNASSDGPFYGEDPNDQVILRLTAHLASPYGSSTALLPQVFESKGSRLFDVTFTSSIAYNDEESYAFNQIDLDLVFSRKKYGGFVPWMPAQLSNECQQCDALMLGSSTVFNDCLKMHVDDSVFLKLLDPENNLTMFDFQETGDDCFGRLLSADFSSNSSSSSSSSSSLSSSSSSSSSQDSEGDDALKRRLTAISQADAGIRCYIDSQCPIGDTLNIPSDGNMVVFACESAAVRATFFEPSFEFHLELTAQGESGLSTLDIASDESEVKIAQIVKRAIPVGEQLNVTVQLFNNSMEIFYATKWNEWLMSEYMRELELSKSSSGSSASGSAGSSSGSAGSSAGSVGSASSKSASSVSSDGSLGSEDSSTGSMGSTIGELSSGSSQTGPSSSSQSGVPPPPPQRRLSSTLTPPVLYVVPRPNFTVEITFNNVSVVPIVTAVISSQNVTWEYSPMTLGFQLAPLMLSKFSYIPPPSQLDLEWDPADQSGSTGSGGSGGNTNALLGSCGECAGAYAACADDEDCRSGVRTYLYQALQRKNFAANLSASIDISGVLRSTSMFVTPWGMTKFSDLVSCLATRTPFCNIDIPRMEANPATGVYEQGPPTFLRIEPMVVTMTIDNGASFSIFLAGQIFEYTEDGNADALRAFLTAKLMMNSTIPTIKVNVSTSPDATSRFYIVEFSNFLLEEPSFASTRTTTDIKRRQGGLWIDGSAYRPIEWQVLLNWLQPLAFDPRDTNTGGGGAQPVPSNPTAICPECMNKLSECLSDFECQSSSREFLETQLKIMVETQAPQPDAIQVQFAELLDSWKTRTTPNAYGKFVSLLSCLAFKSCAVGYNPSAGTASNVQVPTTLIGGSNVRLVIEPGSSIEMSFMGATHVSTAIDSSFDLEQFLESKVFPNGTHVDVYSSVTTDDMMQYGFHVDQLLPGLLSITTSTTVQELSRSTIAIFRSTNSAQPTWRNLLQWFGVPPRVGDTSSGMSTIPDVCTMCFPEISGCMADPVCSAAVRDQLVPSLRDHQIGATNTYVDAVYDGFSTTFRLSLMSMMGPVVNSPAFTTSPPSWNMLSKALMCLASRPCDLKYTSAATAAPATAHAPTYLRYQKALGEVVLQVGSTLSVFFQGEENKFVQSDDLSSFEPWLTQALGGRVILSFPNATMNTITGEFRYEFKLGGYVGMPPHFSIINAGEGAVKPTAGFTQAPDLWFESVNQLPDWQKLIDLVSLTPWNPAANSSSPATTSPTSSGYQCAMCAAVLNNCYGDSMCQFALSNYAIPSFRASILNFQPNADGRLVYDFAPEMTWNTISMAGNLQSRGLLMEVFKCSATNLCLGISSDLAVPGTQASLMLVYSGSNFRIPSGAQMTINFDGATYFFQDSDDTGELKTFLEDTVLLGRGVHVDIKRLAEDATMAQYQIDFQNLYSLTPPVFYWDGPDGPQGMIVQAPWRLLFSSTNDGTYASFKWWIDWLATNGNPTPSPTTVGFQCPNCATSLSNCYSDSACQFALSMNAIPSLRTSISNSQPTTDGRFVYDFAPEMTGIVTPMAGNLQSRGLLMEVFKCSAMSPCLDASSDRAFPGSQASLMLAYPTTSFSIPLGIQMTINFDGAMHLYQENDDTGGLKAFLEGTVLVDRGAYVDIKRFAVDATTVQYQLFFQNLFSLTPPHFTWGGPTAADGPQDMSVEGPWRFVFSSTKLDTYASFKWWIDWLATSVNSITTSM